MFGVIEAQRTIYGKTRCERRLYIGSIAADASSAYSLGCGESASLVP